MEVSCQSRLVGPFCVSFYFRIPMFALSLLSVFLLCLALFKWDWSSPWGGLVNLCHRCTLCNFFRTTSVKVIDNITCFCLSTPTWESRTMNFTFCFASFTLVSLVRSFSSLSPLSCSSSHPRLSRCILSAGIFLLIDYLFTLLMHSLSVFLTNSSLASLNSQSSYVSSICSFLCQYFSDIEVVFRCSIQFYCTFHNTKQSICANLFNKMHCNARPPSMRATNSKASQYIN